MVISVYFYFHTIQSIFYIISFACKTNRLIVYVQSLPFLMFAFEERNDIHKNGTFMTIW